ncbi:hypothetical protein IAU60_004094 [Kwoniella sp. DSM 27419]
MSSGRASTPFPHTQTLSHGHHTSYFHHIPFESQPHAYTAQPLHFQVKRAPTPTPPSLLRKGSNVSTSSAASASSSRRPSVALPSTPRRVSSTGSSSGSESSIASPSMPITPTFESAMIPSRVPTPFALPSPAFGYDNYKRGAPSTSPIDEIPLSLVDAFNYDPYSSHLSTGEPIATGYLPSTPAKRPKFKRRDTPVPLQSTLSSLRMKSLVDEEYNKEERVLRSVIDGGAWVILA